ncbi:MAG: hypothetical protein OHK0013_24960 [Sandaracinaceae bacterium]
MTDRQHEALKRLLGDAGAGGQAKVDALVALSQRTLWVVPWETAEGYRTLVNSAGLAALPVFTSLGELTEASTRFGWLKPDGSVPHKEVGARAAFSYARDRNLGFVVVDIASDHSLEIPRDELEPLLQRGTRDSAGPFAATGRVESSLMAAVRKSEPTMQAVRAPTPPPGSLRAPTPTPGAIPAMRGTATPAGGLPTPTSLPAGALPPRSEPALQVPGGVAQVLPSTRILPPPSAPEDAMLDRLEAILRGFPEVEWGCVGMVGATGVLGLRIDARLRTRVDALADAVAKSSGLAVVTLDDPAHFKAAKAEAFVFYPWRR